MKKRTVHFSIGAVNVSLRSGCKSFIDEFASLYGEYRIPSAGAEAIEVELGARRQFPWWGGPFTLSSEGMSDFQVERRHEVLPHLEWFINWQIIRKCKKYLQLHASSLAREGSALILPGSPGSGKTTLTAGLLTRGWSYLCDEFALVSPQVGTVYPFPRALCIKEPAFAVMDRLGVRLSRETPYHKPTKGRVAFLNPLDVRPDIVGRPALVQWIVFPKYVADGAPVLTPMTRAEAAYELARQCFNFSAYRERALPVLANMVRGAECFRLRMSELAATCDLVQSELFRTASLKAG